MSDEWVCFRNYTVCMLTPVIDAVMYLSYLQNITCSSVIHNGIMRPGIFSEVSQHTFQYLNDAFIPHSIISTTALFGVLQLETWHLAFSLFLYELASPTSCFSFLLINLHLNSPLYIYFFLIIFASLSVFVSVSLSLGLYARPL